MVVVLSCAPLACHIRPGASVDITTIGTKEM
jgi:hypothetical protein